MTPAQRRAARVAQAKHRGSKASHKTALENALLILAWESEALSEGQLSRMLDMDRVSLRSMRASGAVDAGRRQGREIGTMPGISNKADKALEGAHKPQHWAVR